MLSSRASAGSPLAIARACSRRCRAASEAATAGSLAIVGGAGGGKTRSRKRKACAVAAMTSPSWEKPATASFTSGF
jgi:hypothetical protein